MTQVQFEEERAAPRRVIPGADGLTGKIIEWKLAGNEKEAKYVLIGAVIFFLALAAFVIIFFMPKERQIDREERERLEASTPRPMNMRP